MKQNANPTQLEHSVTINAVPADVFAVLTEVEPVLKECSGLSLNPGEEGVTVSSDGTEGLSFSGQLRVTKREEPTSLSMSFDGGRKHTVKWTLKSDEDCTQVTAIITDDLPVSDSESSIDGTRVGGKNKETVGDEPAPSMLLAEMLASLQTLCERPSPPASMAPATMATIDHPYTVDRNPNRDQATKHTLQWLEQMGVVGREQDSELVRDTSLLVSLIHPHASLDVLCLACDFYMWVFLIDDGIDSTDRGTDSSRVQQFQKRFIGVLEGDSPKSADDPLMKATIDIRQRAVDIMSPACYERFVDNVRAYFAAQRWEAHNRDHDNIPDMDAYLPNQRDSTGSRLGYSFGEADSSVDLSHKEYEQESLSSLRETASNIVGWTNDIYSLRKELADDELNNLVVILREEQSCSLQQAVEEARRMVTAEVKRFAEQSEQLVADTEPGSPERVHMNMVEDVFVGSLQWADENTRYISSE